MYNKFSKIILLFIPKTLLLRFIFIICVPTILVQILSIRIFYDRHWYNVTSNTSLVLAKQLKLIEDMVINDNAYYLKNLEEIFDISIKILNNDKSFNYPKISKKKEIKILNDTLQNFLKNQSLVTLNSNNKQLVTFIFFPDKIIKISSSSKALLNVSTEIYIIWILSISLILMIISLVFAKNQIKSILDLADAADNFGKNSEYEYRPSGATEIRKAGVAIIKMSNRIKKNINKRAQMLAMISHDLRTPLTRILLSLELIKENEDINFIKEDALSMKHMIESYLDFARGEESEEFIEVDIKDWILSYINNDYHPNLTNNIKTESFKYLVNLKPLSFRRAISNIITNAEKYASNCYISIKKLNDYIQIILEDDGKGIPESEKNFVFKPFYRVDKARKIDNSGSVGLGLSITREIVKSHKGIISLENSRKYGGLKAVITIPLSRT